jgi:hypothetical protein
VLEISREREDAVELNLVASLTESVGFLGNLIVLLFGVFLLVDGSLGWVADISMFVEAEPLFEFVMGLVFVFFGASFLVRKEQI